MHKFFRFVICVLFCVLIFSETIFAAPADVLQKQTAVVFIGDSSFRMADFYKIVDEKFKPLFPKLVVGDIPQASYRKYWDDQGLLKDPPITAKPVLFDFIKSTSYEQVLVLLISDAEIISRRGGIPVLFWGFSPLSYSQSSIRIRAMLVDTASLSTISDAEVTQKGPVVDHGELGAKRGCFRKAMEYLTSKL